MGDKSVEGYFFKKFKCFLIFDDFFLVEYFKFLVLVLPFIGENTPGTYMLHLIWMTTSTFGLEVTEFLHINF